MLGFKSPILKFFIGVRPDVAADPRHMKNDPILLQTDSKKKSQIREIETTFYEIKLGNSYITSAKGLGGWVQSTIYANVSRLGG